MYGKSAKDRMSMFEKKDSGDSKKTGNGPKKIGKLNIGGFNKKETESEKKPLLKKTPSKKATPKAKEQEKDISAKPTEEKKVEEPKTNEKKPDDAKLKGKKSEDSKQEEKKLEVKKTDEKKPEKKEETMDKLKKQKAEEPAKPKEEPKKTEPAKPKEEPKKTEPPKPKEEPKKTEPAKPKEEPKKAEPAKPKEEPKITEPSKQLEQPKKVETKPKAGPTVVVDDLDLDSELEANLDLMSDIELQSPTGVPAGPELTQKKQEPVTPIVKKAEPKAQPPAKKPQEPLQTKPSVQAGNVAVENIPPTDLTLKLKSDISPVPPPASIVTVESIPKSEVTLTTKSTAAEAPKESAKTLPTAEKSTIQSRPETIPQPTTKPSQQTVAPAQAKPSSTESKPSSIQAKPLSTQEKPSTNASAKPVHAKATPPVQPVAVEADDQEVSAIMNAAIKQNDETVPAEIIISKTFTESAMPQNEFKPIPEEFYNTIFYFSGMGTVVGSALAEGVYVAENTARISLDDEEVQHVKKDRQKAEADKDAVIKTARGQATDITVDLKHLQNLLDSLPTFLDTGVDTQPLVRPSDKPLRGSHFPTQGMIGGGKTPARCVTGEVPPWVKQQPQQNGIPTWKQQVQEGLAMMGQQSKPGQPGHAGITAQPFVPPALREQQVVAVPASIPVKETPSSPAEAPVDPHAQHHEERLSTPDTSEEKPIITTQHEDSSSDKIVSEQQPHQKPHTSDTGQHPVDVGENETDAVPPALTQAPAPPPPPAPPLPAPAVPALHGLPTKSPAPRGGVGVFTATPPALKGGAGVFTATPRAPSGSMGVFPVRPPAPPGGVSVFPVTPAAPFGGIPPHASPNANTNTWKAPDTDHKPGATRVGDNTGDNRQIGQFSANIAPKENQPKYGSVRPYGVHTGEANLPNQPWQDKYGKSKAVELPQPKPSAGCVDSKGLKTWQLSRLRALEAQGYSVKQPDDFDTYAYAKAASEPEEDNSSLAPFLVSNKSKKADFRNLSGQTRGDEYPKLYNKTSGPAQYAPVNSGSFQPQIAPHFKPKSKSISTPTYRPVSAPMNVPRGFQPAINAALPYCDL